MAHALPLDSQTGAPFADGWEALDTESYLPCGDKCWIVAGEMNEEVQEFYMTYNAGSGNDQLQYARSTDGGYTWVGGPILVDSTQVEGLLGSYMAVVDDGPLYVLDVRSDFPDAGATLRVVEGADQQDGTVRFSFLPAGPFFQVPYLEIPITQYSIQNYVPRPSAAPWSDITSSPRISADPTDPNVLHIVCADLVDDSDPDDGDVDVFYVKVTKHFFLGSPYWTASNPLRVNDDQVNQNSIADQYLPDIAVDSEGVIHVIFYDDRDFIQDDDETNVRFHVYYAYSDDGGENFSPNVRFYLEDPEDPPASDPCLDEDSHATTVYYELGEYIGLTVRTIGDGAREIWTSYSGTSSVVEDEEEQFVIWSTRIPWFDE